MSLSKLLLVAAFLPTIVAQQSRSVMPMIAGGAVPLYPPLARAAKIQGVVHVRITTDGSRAVTAQAEDGQRLLAVAAEENARTWQFSKHSPMSFMVTYRYRLDADADPNNPTVTLRFLTEIDVSIAPLVISDPSAETKK
ncbi:MAG: energy transducer TonB [Bryobacterales bacterium]|nr:energy transducer TonB [Bryobacterales bacterium]